MTLRHDPEAEEKFRSYSALLDLQERLKTAEKTLLKDSSFYQEAPQAILEQTSNLTRQIHLLLDIVKETAKQIKTPSVEDRGYKPENRGVWSNSKCKCDGDCGSGGGCSGGGCNP